MKRIRSKFLKVIFIIVAVIVLFIIVSFIRHKICSFRERKLLTPLGKIVEVNGHNMSVYTEGEGDKTLVFLSGGGTCSPILDFKSLYSLLSNKYKIAVVEKFGYGFSDVVDEQRDIDTMLSETRMALEKAGIEGPYVLCPHSMSGLEALYWAQKYPEEVEAPSLAESDAIKVGTLSEEEKEIYRAVFYQRTATVTMIDEVKAVKDNAKTVKENGVPQVPMLLFISNGSGGTGFTKETWRRIPKEYIAGCDNASYIELDCPHYVHDYEYEKISEEIRNLLKKMY
ncbi:MAG: alpha/beta hydrolase [Clostridium sp.]|nr:alpha/beta hydrolase [Clostridium sp.]